MNSKKTNANIAILTCLQDAIILNNRNNIVQSNEKINFAQYLIFQCNDNLNKEIDIDYYLKKYNSVDVNNINNLK